jgi:GntR family transcriptional regulator
MANRLRIYLSQQEFLPGERLGDERSLAAALGVPRSKLRLGLSELEREGLICRTIGRTGGVAYTGGRIERGVNTVAGLPDIARAQGLTLETRVLMAGVTLAGPADQRALGLQEGDRIYQLRRLRSVNGTPLSVETTRVPAEMFPGLLKHDLSAFYNCLRTVYGVELERSDETLEVILAESEQAQLLEVAPGSALVLVRRVALDGSGRRIEAGEEIFVAQRMRFHLRRQGRVSQGHS